MGKITNPLRRTFTPTQRPQRTQRSAATSQPRTGRRRVGLSEIGAKRRLPRLFGQLKSLFSKKNIISRTVTANTGTTPIRTATQATQQPTHSVLENAKTGMPRGDKMLSQVKSLFSRTLFHKDLYVTKNYIQEFSNNNISFTNLGTKQTKQTGDTLKLTQERPTGYSNHLTEFCGFNGALAVNLSALLTKEGLNIVSSSITGQANCQWTEKSFDVSQTKEEDIKVEIKGTFVDPTGKQTKVENVTILLPSGSYFTQPLNIETVAFLETQEPASQNPNLTPSAGAIQS